MPEVSSGLGDVDQREPAMPQSVVELKRELDVPVGARSLIPLRDFLTRALADAGMEPDRSRIILIGLDAAISSVTVGNGSDSRRGHVTVLIDINDTRLRVLVRDLTDGSELQAGAEELAIKTATRPRGELALSVLRRVMDEVNYRYTKGFQNELELVRYL
jgi:anti-sigma regulatory factor (Ser/Thr protein kinase)